MIFLQNLLEEGKACVKHDGAHCRSAESIRTACEPYFRRQLWSRIFDWSSWIVPVVIPIVVIMAELDPLCYLLTAPAIIVCIALCRWLDPEKLVRANPQMKEFIKIRHLWEPQRAFYLKSGYVGHLAPSFYKLSEHEGTQLGFDCMAWVINGETHKLRSALKDIMTNAMLKVAHEFHIIEHTAGPECITEARQQLVLLLGQLNEGSYTFISTWTVGGAIKAAVKIFGEYSPSKGVVVPPSIAIGNLATI